MATLQKRVDAIWLAAHRLVENHRSQQMAAAEDAFLPVLDDIYKQLASLNRKRYCRCAVGNELSGVELQRESELKTRAKEVLERIGWSDRTARYHKWKDHAARIVELRVKRSSQVLAEEECAELAGLQEKYRILFETPAEQARQRLYYFTNCMLPWNSPIPQSEYEEFLRLEAIIHSYPLNEDELLQRLYRPSAECLAFGAPIVSRPVSSDVVQYNINTAVSVLVADQGEVREKLGNALYRNGIADYVWSMSLLDALDRLTLYPYDLVIVNLDHDWGPRLIRRINSGQFTRKPAVLPFTSNADTQKNWHGACLADIRAEPLALNLQRIGLTRLPNASGKTTTGEK